MEGDDSKDRGLDQVCWWHGGESGQFWRTRVKEDNGMGTGRMNRTRPMGSGRWRLSRTENCSFFSTGAADSILDLPSARLLPFLPPSWLTEPYFCNCKNLKGGTLLPQTQASEPRSQEPVMVILFSTCDLARVGTWPHSCQWDTREHLLGASPWT